MPYSKCTKKSIEKCSILRYNTYFANAWHAWLNGAHEYSQNEYLCDNVGVVYNFDTMPSMRLESLDIVCCSTLIHHHHVAKAMWTSLKHNQKARTHVLKILNQAQL